MRDLERWKDKVELSLDGRQIFFLFFGSAVLACLLFVGGVLVGKRIEQRALRAQSNSAEDPLAALDRLGAADEDEGLTFHQALAPSGKVAPVHGRAPARKEPSAEPAHAPAAKPAQPVALPAAPSADALAPAPEGNGRRFTLQLSAFVEKEDAQQFMQKIQEAGYQPFLVQSDIPGRGIFYRVRVGDFASKRAATEAKNELEKKQHVVAYVTKL
jgi:cell division septation protein DedD